MKKSMIAVIAIIMTILITLTGAVYAANENVTLEKVKDNICKIEFDSYGNLTKKLISVDNSSKTATLQVEVENIKTEEESVEPSEIFFVIDNSRSMRANSVVVDGQTVTRQEAVFSAAKLLAESILKQQPSTKIGVVSFSTNTDTSKVGTIEDASMVLQPTSNIDTIKAKIDGITANGDQTNIDAGLQVASNNFSTGAGINQYLILLTDGIPNTAVGGITQQYSGEVTTKTKETLQSIVDKGINIVTVMTGVNASYQPDPDGNLCAEAAGKTYYDLATEVFGTQAKPSYGKFYYVSDENATKTITENVYADVVQIVTNEITDIIVEDYLPDNIIENYDVAVTGVTSSNNYVVMENPVIDLANKKIIWNIQTLPAGAKVSFTYTLTLKEKFNENIINLETPTNKKVDVKYKAPTGEESTKTSDVSPSIILRKVDVSKEDNTVAPEKIPETGDKSGTLMAVILVSAILLCIGISKYFKEK